MLACPCCALPYDARNANVLYRETITRAKTLSYADDFWLLLAAYCSMPLLIAFTRRVRSDPSERARRGDKEGEAGGRDPGRPAPPD